MGCELACWLRVSIRVKFLQKDACPVGEGRGFRRGGVQLGVLLGKEAR